MLRSTIPKHLKTKAHQFKPKLYRVRTPKHLRIRAQTKEIADTLRELGKTMAVLSNIIIQKEKVIMETLSFVVGILNDIRFDLYKERLKANSELSSQKLQPLL